MATAAIDILIQAKDEASQVLARIKTQAENMATGYKTLGAGMTAAGAGITAVVGLSMNAAMEVEAVAGAFEHMATSAGQSADEILAAMREASGGTISDSDLMLAANRAMVLGVANNADEFTSLMEIARDRARTMGLTTTQAFNDIVTGIGRGSPLILDNLGLIVDVAAANEAYAAQLGKTAGELTSAEQSQALVNAVLEQGRQTVDQNALANMTASESVQALKSSIGNITSSIGESFLPLLQSVVTSVSGIIENVKAWMEENPKLADTVIKIAAAVGAALAVFGPLLMMLPGLATAIGAVGMAIQVATGPVGLIVLAITALIAIGVALWQNWDTISAKAKEIWNNVKEFFVNLWEGIKTAFKAAWEWIKNLFLNYHPYGLIIKHWDTIVDFFKGLWEKVTGAFETAWNGIRDFFGGIWDGMVDAVKGAVNGILGFINGMISGVENGINSIIGAINSIPSITIPDWVPLIGGKEFGIPDIGEVSLPKLPEFAAGGMVPGAIGQPMPILAHGGETVLPVGATIVVQNILDGEVISERVYSRINHNLQLQNAF